MEMTSLKLLPDAKIMMYDERVDNLHSTLIMLDLHRIATNLGPIYELKNSGFLGLVSNR